MLRSSLLSTSALVAATALGFLGLQQPVHAETATTGTYASLFAGVAQNRPVDTLYDGDPTLPFSVEFDRGYVLGLAVGWQFGNGVRAELEYSVGRASASQGIDEAGGVLSAIGDLNTRYLLANVWYDWDSGSQFKPYAGGGLGLGRTNSTMNFGGSGLGYGPSENGIAYQVGVGFSVEVALNGVLDVGYRYKTIRDIDFADAAFPAVLTWTDGTIREHVLQVGMRFGF